jgi:ABC-2 type transport system ATP-binding protein
LREHVTIFVSTAYLDEAERCHRLALIHNGRLLAVGTPDEIKRLMRGTIIEIRSGQARQVTALLRQQIYGGAAAVSMVRLESVALFGDRVHAVTVSPEETLGGLGSLLAGAGLECHGIGVVEPTLEDVFVSVLAQEKRAEMADERR